MAKTKAKVKVDELVLVPTNRRQQRRLRIFITLAVIVMVVGAFFSGQFSQRYNESQLQRANRGFQQQVAELDGALQSMRSELALHRTGSQVSMQAQEQVRTELRDLKTYISELEEAVNFYKSIMAPNTLEQGIRLDRFDLALAEGNEAGIRFVLSQVGDNRDLTNGAFTLRLEGSRGAETQVLGVPKLTLEGTDGKFRFRYFQDISLRLGWPEGFVPQRLIIEVQTSGRRPQRLERVIDWPKQIESEE